MFISFQSSIPILLCVLPLHSHLHISIPILSPSRYSSFSHFKSYINLYASILRLSSCPSVSLSPNLPFIYIFLPPPSFFSLVSSQPVLSPHFASSLSPPCQPSFSPLNSSSSYLLTFPPSFLPSPSLPPPPVSSTLATPSAPGTRDQTSCSHTVVEVGRSSASLRLQHTHTLRSHVLLWSPSRPPPHPSYSAPSPPSHLHTRTHSCRICCSSRSFLR